jgi:hypothetical protein
MPFSHKEHGEPEDESRNYKVFLVFLVICVAGGHLLRFAQKSLVPVERIRL